MTNDRLLTDAEIVRVTGTPIFLARHRRLAEAQRDLTAKAKDEEWAGKLEQARKQILMEMGEYLRHFTTPNDPFWRIVESLLRGEKPK